MANKWISAAATAALFCGADWLAATRTSRAPATPIAPVATPAERPLVAARGFGRIEVAVARAMNARVV